MKKTKKEIELLKLVPPHAIDIDYYSKLFKIDLLYKIVKPLVVASLIFCMSFIFSYALTQLLNSF